MRDRSKETMRKSLPKTLLTADGSITMPQRVWDKIETSETCWLWIGATSGGQRPYGITWDGQRRVKAHRYVFEARQNRRPIPGDLTVDHLCKNTLCVRPSHMEIVTLTENVMRSNAPGPLAVRTNRCKRDHEFTPENTRHRKDGGRDCLACRRIHRTEEARRRKGAAA